MMIRLSPRDYEDSQRSRYALLLVVPRLTNTDGNVFVTFGCVLKPTNAERLHERKRKTTTRTLY